MGRQIVKGLDYTYFTLDFFQDRKIRRMQRKYGPESPLVYLALLSVIYREGYYIPYDEDLALDIADYTRLDEEYVSKVIDGLLDVGLLSREMCDQHHILTSHGIQKNYKNVCEKSKRKSTIEEFSLISSEEMPISSEEKGDSSEEMPINSEFGTQSKVKKSKVKKSKENYYSSIEEEKEEILSFCFFKNWAAPSKEYAKIVAYNNTGGRSWDSMTRTQKESALALWKQQPEHPPRFGQLFLSFWENIYTNLCSLNAPYDVRMDALSDSIAETIRGNTLFLHCTDRLRLFIERHLDVFKPIIRAYQSRFGLTQLNYTIFNHDYPDGKGLAQDPDAPA